MRSWTELLRPLVPVPVRVRVALTRRALRDVRSGARWSMVGVGSAAAVEAWPERVSVSQSLGRSSYLEGKRHNLALAIRRLQDVRVPPGRLFSFWRLVGSPSRRRGFVDGRNLVGGALMASEGGGLCQLSGLIHLMALRAGLQVVERHPHSVDLYTEETRFAPLGSDATVVYGYKDLRLRNVLPFPVALRFHLEEDRLTGSLHAPAPVETFDVEFVTRDAPDARHVTAWRQRPGASAKDLLGTSRYARPAAKAP
ncbi:VanW family protein [Pyxidicoccus xibeiensis]|uniref:VanW family protein n=1 Tax=Pyxidicoccus xibeiensis TaxID=2906759 RepID=UPI0020A73794|nr:VanW family protein [Pyxidicoccus xibeiensis]MCP3145264.1 VanW family protein [Pyxidicoccus xibeiensis]